MRQCDAGVGCAVVKIDRISVLCDQIAAREHCILNISLMPGKITRKISAIKLADAATFPARDSANEVG